jgi:hypothetical protein
LEVSYSQWYQINKEVGEEGEADRATVSLLEGEEGRTTVFMLVGEEGLTYNR